MALLCFANYDLSAQEADSGAVRVRVDVENVTIQMDGETVTIDYYGNPILVNAWFILNLKAGEYDFQFTNPEYDLIERHVVLQNDSIVSIDLDYIVTEPVLSQGTLIIRSNPDSAHIMINNELLENTTPTQLSLNSGDYKIEVFKDGLEPLPYNIKIDPQYITSLDFILRAEFIANVVPESLGLAYKILMPLTNVQVVNTYKKRFNDLTESFAVFPLGQGILAKMMLGNEQSETTDVLIISGVVLTAGTYFLGKIFTSRKHKNIIEENARITEFNAYAAQGNNEIDIEMEAYTTSLYDQWEIENKERGKVIENNELITVESTP
jgi:hypothetical protein